MLEPSAPDVKVRAFESESSLQEFLRQPPSQSLLLGQGSDSRREFFALEIENVSARVGIESVGGGVKPAVVRRGGRLWIGFNDRVALVNLDPLHVAAEVDLLSLFWTFLEIPARGQVLVLAETAVVAISEGGVVEWRVDTDLITDFTLKANTIELILSDSPAIEVDLLSGTTRVRTR